MKSRGLTLIELVTALVVVAVLAAVAVPLWRAHLLRVRRTDATNALIKVQAAQDQQFGRNARYADSAQLTRPPPQGLGLGPRSEHGYYDIELRSKEDGLGYVATARARPSTGQSEDARCVEFSLDENGRRRAADAQGNDRSPDCWH